MYKQDSHCILPRKIYETQKLSKYKISTTPWCSKPINLDIDKLEQLPSPSCYPVGASLSPNVFDLLSSIMVLTMFSQWPNALIIRHPYCGPISQSVQPLSTHLSNKNKFRYQRSFLPCKLQITFLWSISGRINQVTNPNLTNSLWNKEESSQQWKDCITVPVQKKGKTTYYGTYWSTELGRKSNILSSLISLVMQNFWRCRCGFRRNR